MNLAAFSVKHLFFFVFSGILISMSIITVTFYMVTKQRGILVCGAALTFAALFWIFLLTLIFGKRLSLFTAELCRTLDSMINGNDLLHSANDSETLFARINHRLARLYQILLENRRIVNKERQELQALLKTSRLETGVIQLVKKDERLYDTVAQALSGIVYDAEKKDIEVTVDCPQNLYLYHDSNSLVRKRKI